MNSIGVNCASNLCTHHCWKQNICSKNHLCEKHTVHQCHHTTIINKNHESSIVQNYMIMALYKLWPKSMQSAQSWYANPHESCMENIDTHHPSMFLSINKMDSHLKHWNLVTIDVSCASTVYAILTWINQPTKKKVTKSWWQHMSSQSLMTSSHCDFKAG